MEKEILFSLKGLQMGQEDQEELETIMAAEYYLRNDHHYIVYLSLIHILFLFKTPGAFMFKEQRSRLYSLLWQMIWCGCMNSYPFAVKGENI